MAWLASRGRKWIAGTLAVLALSVAAYAASGGEKPASRTPKPTIVIEQGEKCVEPTEYMRRNHMKLLMHQRDDTMHQGIRTKKHSLQNCIDCHASKQNNSVLGTDQNFCQSCHTYAAVSLDCWECHASKPKRATQPTAGVAATAPVVGGTSK